MTVAPELAPALLVLGGEDVSAVLADGSFRTIGRTDSVPVAVEAVRTRRADVVVAVVDSPERLQELTTAVPAMAGAPVVVASVLPTEVALLPAMAAGARAFLQVPFDGDLLDLAVASVLAGDALVDPRSTGWLVDLAVRGRHAATSSGLTLRQSQVVVLVRSGLTNREIAEVLGLSPDTVKTHLKEAMKRLGVRDRWAATALARRLEQPRT